MNLLTDRWIPVLHKDGKVRAVAPHEVADANLIRFAWSRPDFNTACLEFLIGLVFLADPPSDADDWEDRRVPDAQRLQKRLLAHAHAFNLDGPGPRVLQDFEPFDQDDPDRKNMSGLDTLFIGSAGEQTIKHNKDLMVTRRLETVLDLPTAAMALITLQFFAPVGGSGIRAGLRGGGPITTLVDPGNGLWDMVWANVPYGAPGTADNLPWMRSTRTSEKGSPTHITVLEAGNSTYDLEVFFSMPRRLRLGFSATGDQVVGVWQRNLGTNYTETIHPLTPYYEDKDGNLLPCHPNGPRYGYENWLGQVVQGKSSTIRRAVVLGLWEDRMPRETAKVHVSGWNMSNAKAVDYMEARQIVHFLDEERNDLLEHMIEASQDVAQMVADRIGKACGPEMKSHARTLFFELTEEKLSQLYNQLSFGEPLPNVGTDWYQCLRDTAIRLFDQRTTPLLSQRDTKRIKKVIKGRRDLLGIFGKRTQKAKELRANLRTLEGSDA